MLGFQTILGGAVSALALSMAPIMMEAPLVGDEGGQAPTPVTVAMVAPQEAAQDGQALRNGGEGVEPPAEMAVGDAEPLFSDEAEGGSYGLENFSAEPEGDVVFADLTDEQILDKVIDYIEGIDTFSANFVQTAPSGTVSAGQMLLKRPGRMRVEYEAPNPQLVVATQGIVYIHDKDLGITDSYPLRRTPLRFLLSKKIKSDQMVLNDVTRTSRSVSIGLTSSDEETEGELVLVFEAPDLVLRRWAVIDPSNNVTILDLEDIKLGERIAASQFRVPEAGGSFTRDH